MKIVKKIQMQMKKKYSRYIESYYSIKRSWATILLVKIANKILTSNNGEVLRKNGKVHKNARSMSNLAKKQILPTNAAPGSDN